MQRFASCSSLILLILLSAEMVAEGAIVRWYEDSECSGVPIFEDEFVVSTSSMCCTSCRVTVGPHHGNGGGSDFLSATCQDGKVVFTWEGCTEQHCSNCSDTSDWRWWYSSENMDKFLAGECHAHNETNNEFGHATAGFTVYGKATETIGTHIMTNVCKETTTPIVVAPIPETPVSSSVSVCKSEVGFIFFSVLAFRTLVI